MKKERSKELFSPESCSPVLSGGIRDFTVHGTEPVPLHIYHQDYAHGGLSVPFHWHKELEWIWVEKGTLTLTLKTETRNPDNFRRYFSFHQQSRTASALQHWNYPFGSPCPCISSRNSLMCLSGFL